METRIAGILLAAGSSTRFGSDKVLYKLENGDPIGIKAAKKLKQFVDDIKIVLPKQNKQREKHFASYMLRALLRRSYSSNESIRFGINIIFL